MSKHYRLLGADGRPYESHEKGTLGGNGRDRLYGRLDCPSAARALACGESYRRHRVFFADEATAIAAGFRPCHRCMRAEYARWKAGPQPAEPYPWRVRPRSSAASAVALAFAVVVAVPAASLGAQDTVAAPVVAPAGATLELLAAAIGAASRREPIVALSGALNCDATSAALDSASVQVCGLLGPSASRIVAEFARGLGRPAEASWPSDPVRALPVCAEETAGDSRRDDRRRDRFARISAPVVGERDGKWEGRMTLELSCRVVRPDGRVDVRTLAREYLCQWDGRAWRLYQVATRRITD